MDNNNIRITGCSAHTKLSRLAACEGMVLLKNEERLLPLRHGEKIALFGKGASVYIKGGGGSGDVFCAYVRNLYDGFAEKEKEGKVCVNTAVEKFYADYLKEEQAAGRPLMGVNVRTEPLPPQSLVDAAAKQSDVAIITISRFSTEGTDRPLEGDYYLTEEEKQLISMVTCAFKKTVLVLNVGAVTDSAYFKENAKIQSVLLAWQAGMEGGAAIADILCGDAVPSGKLVDTFAKNFEDYPSSQGLFDDELSVAYYDDIYVGYRYFETIPEAKDKVNYPFGFGLSYTSFAMSGLCMEESDGVISAKLRVQNTGVYRGKQVVQLYFSAPQGVLGKPALQLGAFAKTKELKPMESEELCLKLKVDDMASYDDLGKIQKSAYILEKGVYSFYIGFSVRDTEKASFAYTVDADRVTQQLTERLVPHKLTKRMLADGSFENMPLSDGVYTYGKNKAIDVICPIENPKFEDVGTKLSLDEFVAAFTTEELCEFMGGSPNVGVSNTLSFSGMERLGVDPVPTADGPAGLRLDAHHGIPTTAWPCATLLACSWNVSLVEQIGAAGAAELKENGLKVWLTPAINIHRTPLCGRNFEYFSEDPFVAGKMAAAKVKGIQSQGVACSVKHFAANNIELNRIKGDSIVSERALREVYLKGFEICVKEANPWTIMSSYNLINGIHSSESYDLITGILRGEWGFGGMVTTDWGIKNNPVNEVKAGNDMKMHIGYPEDLMAAIEKGELERADLEACAKRILKVYKLLA